MAMNPIAIRDRMLVGFMVSAISLTLSSAAFAEPSRVTVNGFPTAQSTAADRDKVEFQTMLLKYAARCALREDQELEGPADATGQRPKFRGALGVAPEWRDGKCDGVCQQKVSSCLIALINRTGKHVQLSLLSAAPTLPRSLGASDNDIAFPHQEGAFFGNVFSGQAYACRGRDVEKGAQVKRFCALAPESCSGLAEFADAGRCEDACEMTCRRLSDGSERCAAAACTDPQGRRWAFPITTYLRNQIEAGNADRLDGTRATNDEAVEPLGALGAARYERIDFGAAGRNVKTFTARLAARRPGARIEVWLDGDRRLGVLDVKGTGGAEQDQSAVLDARGVSGMHAVVLKLTGATDLAHLSTIEFR
jgi:hypothetical protein